MFIEKNREKEDATPVGVELSHTIFLL